MRTREPGVHLAPWYVVRSSSCRCSAFPLLEAQRGRAMHGDRLGGVGLGK
jgi:hypothetical protein